MAHGKKSLRKPSRAFFAAGFNLQLQLDDMDIGQEWNMEHGKGRYFMGEDGIVPSPRVACDY